MGDLIKGFVHVHSEYSREGLSSLADLAGFARESGYRFVGITDHAEDLSPDDMRNLQRECEELSDAACVVIPGLEFRCTGDIHILGIGFVDPIANNDPVAVASQIDAKGGLPILAHPAMNGYCCPPEMFRALKGIEIWNATYDGRFVPPLPGLRLVREARNINPSIFGIGGADLHWLHRDPEVVLEIPVKGKVEITNCMVLTNLAAGYFTIRGRYVHFSAMSQLDGLALVPLWSFRKLYEVCMAVRNAALGEA